MASKPIDPLDQLIDEMIRKRHDPLGYAMLAFPWESAKLPEVGPRVWQCDVMEDIHDHLKNPATRYEPLRIAVASGHGIGKSALIAMLIDWASDTCEDTRIVITANTEQQLRTKT